MRAIFSLRVPTSGCSVGLLSFTSGGEELGFPQASHVAYFSRTLAINLNDSNLDPRKAGMKFGECAKFLDEIERDPSTFRR